jgi:hypothetical protein
VALCHVILEPKTGYTDQEIILIIWVWGSYYIEQLTTGFIEAHVEEYYIPWLKKIASVHIKPPINLHPSYKKRMLNIKDFRK